MHVASVRPPTPSPSGGDENDDNIIILGSVTYHIDDNGDIVEGKRPPKRRRLSSTGDSPSQVAHGETVQVDLHYRIQHPNQQDLPTHWLWELGYGGELKTEYTLKYIPSQAGIESTSDYEFNQMMRRRRATRQDGQPERFRHGEARDPTPELPPESSA